MRLIARLKAQRKPVVSSSEPSVTGELASALRAGDLVVHYQPEVALDSRAIVGAEALLRWHRADGVLVAAEKFIPNVLGSPVLRAIDDWVLYQSATVVARLRSIRPDFRVWVNVSPLDLGDGTLVERIRGCRTALCGIGIEIGESAVMRNVDVAVHALHAAREAGIAVALDDFGTGHSSLAQLKRLPLDVLKLDRAFVHGLPRDDHDRYVVEAVIQLAKGFALSLIAEGVEREEQADWLRAAGCGFGQGYLFGRAMPAAELEALLG